MLHSGGPSHSYVLHANTNIFVGLSSLTFSIWFVRSFPIFAPMCRYYSATIIKMAGVEKDTVAIWLAAAVAFGNFIFTVVGVYLVERSGRRKLLLGSLAGVIFALLFLSGGFLVVRLQTPAVVYDDALAANSTCGAYSDCHRCTLNAHCGFCYIKDGSYRALNGSCQAAMASEKGAAAGEKSVWWNSSYSDYDPDVKCVPAFAENNPEVFSSNGTLEATWVFDYCPARYAYITIVGLVVYIMMFAPGMGPMPWTINAELYPSWARSTANAVATAVNWICNLIISMTFLTVSNSQHVGRVGAFAIYAVIALVCWVLLYRALPETKNKSLEEAEKLFEQPWCGGQCCGGNEKESWHFTHTHTHTHTHAKNVIFSDESIKSSNFYLAVLQLALENFLDFFFLPL